MPTKYRIKPIMDFGFKQYIIEKQKKFLFWNYWSAVKEETRTGEPAAFWYKEHAEKFMKELLEAEK